MFVQNFARRPGLGNADAERALWLQMKAAMDAGQDINDVQMEWQRTRGITPGMFWRIFETYFNAPNNDPSQVAPTGASMSPRAYQLAAQGLGWAEIMSTIAAEVGRSYDYVQAALNSVGFQLPERTQPLPPGTVDISQPTPPGVADPLAGFSPSEIANVGRIVMSEGFRGGAVPQETARRTRADYGAILEVFSQFGILWDAPIVSNMPAAPQTTLPVAAPPPPVVTVSAPAPAPVQSPVQSVETGGGVRPGAGGGWVPAPQPLAPPPPGAGTIPGTIPGTISTGGTVPSEGTAHNLPDAVTATGAPAPKSAAGLLILAALALLAGQ